MVLSHVPYTKAGWVSYSNLGWGIYAEFLKYKKLKQWVVTETTTLADKGETLTEFAEHTTRRVGYTGNAPRCFNISISLPLKFLNFFHGK